MDIPQLVGERKRGEEPRGSRCGCRLRDSDHRGWTQSNARKDSFKRRLGIADPPAITMVSHAVCISAPAMTELIFSHCVCRPSQSLLIGQHSRHFHHHVKSPLLSILVQSHAPSVTSSGTPSLFNGPSTSETIQRNAPLHPWLRCHLPTFPFSLSLNLRILMTKTPRFKINWRVQFQSS